MTTFTHLDPPELTELETETVDGKRFYVTPDGKKYPSVTTVSSFASAKSIAAWRRRVGNEQANKISTQAAGRGTAVHKLCEDYLNNVPDYTKNQMPVNIESFNTIKPILDDHINNIRMQEVPLYSHYLEVGGRVDCIAEWDGRLSVIDFKTARKIKKKEWISGYFMQCSAYAVMYEELTKLPISQIVIIISVDGESPQTFIERRDNYIHDFIKLRKEFKSYHGV